VIAVGREAVVNVAADQTGGKAAQGGGLIMKAEVFLAGGVAEVMPVADRLLGISGERSLHFLGVIRVLCVVFAVLEAELEACGLSGGDEFIQAAFDAAPDEDGARLAASRIHL